MICHTQKRLPHFVRRHRLLCKPVPFEPIHDIPCRVRCQHEVEFAASCQTGLREVGTAGKTRPVTRLGADQIQLGVNPALGVPKADLQPSGVLMGDQPCQQSEIQIRCPSPVLHGTQDVLGMCFGRRGEERPPVWSHADQEQHGTTRHHNVQPRSQLFQPELGNVTHTDENMPRPDYCIMHEVANSVPTCIINEPDWPSRISVACHHVTIPPYRLDSQGEGSC